MSLFRTRALCGTAAVAAVLAAAAWAFTDASRANQPAMPKESDLKPRWEIGDSWVVETSSRPVHLRAAADPKADPKGVEPVVVKYKFAVEAKEKVGTRDCYRVEVTVFPDPKGQPATKLWYDAASMTLRQVETQLPVDGGFVPVTESYSSDPNAPAPPAIGLMSTLPVELPMFVGGRPGEMTFSYEAVAGKAGSKRAADDVAFAVDMKQTLAPTTPEKARGMLPKSFTRDLTNKPLVEVKLVSPERTVTQLWEAGQPWPVYTDNGSTTSKLVDVTRAKK